MSGIRDGFEQRFGAEQARAIVRAAESHTNGVHDRCGTDPFRWALLIAIGYDCLTQFRDEHGITADPDELRAWVIEHADLAAHDGDIDYLSALAGAYDDWMSRTPRPGGVMSDDLDARLDAISLVERAVADDRAAMAVLLEHSTGEHRDMVLLTLVALARDLAVSLALVAGVAPGELLEAARAIALFHAITDPPPAPAGDQS